MVVEIGAAMGEIVSSYDLVVWGYAPGLAIITDLFLVKFQI